MGRLIDEDAVIKAIDKHTRDDGVLDDDISVILEEIQTAFYKEKVKAELKNEIELVVKDYPLHGRYIKKNRAIEIVEKGGTE